MAQELHDRASCAAMLFHSVKDIIPAGLAVPAGMLAVPPAPLAVYRFCWLLMLAVTGCFSITASTT